LTRAAEGFDGLSARWEAALARLWLAEAQLATGMAGARESAQAAHDVFDALRSVRELEHARELLGRLR
jgi:hypothetical protein